MDQEWTWTGSGPELDNTGPNPLWIQSVCLDWTLDTGQPKSNPFILCVVEKCAGCSKPLKEDGFFALGELYHKSCFR